MKIEKEIRIEDYEKKIPELRVEFGINKKFPKKYELPVLITLSYFPELKNQKIRFFETKNEFAYASRPAFASLFYSYKNRAYEIILSTRSTKVPDKLLFKSLSLNAQVGILGHELSHTVYYLNKNTSQLISTAFGYLFSKYRVKFEKETDRATIQRGLGFQLLEFALYCRKHPDTPSRLINWLNKYYMHPDQIIQCMKNTSGYNL